MPNKYNICLLNDSFPPVIDGVANAVVNYAGEIERCHGHAIVATPHYPDADDTGFPFPVVRYPSIDTREAIGYVAGVPFSPELSVRLERENTSLLHSHCPVASTILARELRETLDVPLVFTYHTKFDIDIANAVESKLLRQEAIYALVQNITACDEVWVVSRGAGDNLRSLGYEGDMLVMENGVDVPRARVPEDLVLQTTAGYDLPAGLPVYLFVGRLMWYKGLRIILDALAAMKRDGYDYRMVFIGGGGDEAEIKAYTEKLGLADRVFFPGAISDRDTIRAWYCRADLFLFPSTFDTNGLVVREAAACSLASVLIAGSCAAEGVADGVNGYLIREDPGSLTEKLEALYSHRDSMRAVGEGAARELYISWSDAVAKACERYGIVIENYRSGVYRRRRNLADELLSTRGVIMELFGEAEELGRSVNDLLGKPLDRFSERFGL